MANIKISILRTTWIKCSVTLVILGCVLQKISISYPFYSFYELHQQKYSHILNLTPNTYMLISSSLDKCITSMVTCNEPEWTIALESLWSFCIIASWTAWILPVIWEERQTQKQQLAITITVSHHASEQESAQTEIKCLCKNHSSRRKFYPLTKLC